MAKIDLLGDAAGLATLGGNLTTPAPGAVSAISHWHEVEDEMVSVIAGELTLVEETGESVLGPGDAAGFRARVPNAHHVVNRGSAPATSLEIGTRPVRDRCHDAHVDLVAHDDDGRTWFTTRAGTRLSEPKERFA